MGDEHMVTVRTAKAKGSSFEYDCQHSLKKLFSDIFRTSERGFQLQYDLQSDAFHHVFECKRLKAISWNQALKYYNKLEEKTPKKYSCSLLFQSNQQPCLVMKRHKQLDKNPIVIMTFEDVYKIPFEKHPSTRSS